MLNIWCHGVDQVVAHRYAFDMMGGKSGLQRAGCWVIPRRSDPTSAPQKTYRRRASRVMYGMPVMSRYGKGEKVG